MSGRVVATSIACHDGADSRRGVYPRRYWNRSSRAIVCSVACNACGRCAADAPGIVRMQNGLAVVDYDRMELESRKAIERCPTGAIAWVEGAQFAGGTLRSFRAGGETA